MPVKKPKLGLKIGPRQKKIIAIAAVAAIVLIFVSFLLSLSSDKEETAGGQSTAVQTESNVGSSGELQIPTSQRYDYANLLNEPEDAQQGPSPADDPFAHMKEQSTAEPEAWEAPTAQGNAGEASSSAQGEITPPAAQGAGVQAVLFCDSFPSSGDAESQKARIAFQGVASEIVQRQGAYSLRIGPFANRDAARAMFGSLADKGLVRECSLTDY